MGEIAKNILTSEQILKPSVIAHNTLCDVIHESVPGQIFAKILLPLMKRVGIVLHFPNMWEDVSQN